MKQLFNNVKSQHDHLEHQHVLDLVDTLIGRRTVRITFPMVIKEMLSNILPCKKMCLTEETRKSKRMFAQAQQMLNRQFDIKNLLRNSILIKLLISTMLTKQQSLLLLFQRKQVIEPEKDISSSASDLDFREKFNSMITSKNPWDRVFALYKMFDILNRYKENEQLDPIDKQLIKGVYSRSQHNYKHLQKDYFSDEEDTFKSSDISENEQS